MNIVLLGIATIVLGCCMAGCVISLGILYRKVEKIKERLEKIEWAVGFAHLHR